MFPCAWKQFLGISCPMCGFQRSVIKLLEGDAAGSFAAFPPLFVFFASIIYTIVRRIVQRRKQPFSKSAGTGSGKILAIINIAALVFNFFYQNF